MNSSKEKTVYKRTPKPPVGMRCVALNSNGIRCRRPALVGIPYHGDHELYGWHDAPDPSWVLAFFCKIHSGKAAR